MALRERVLAGMPLRTWQVTFIAPVPAGSVAIRAGLLHQGPSAIQVETSLCDGGNALSQLVGVFGNARPSTLDFQPEQPTVAHATAPELRYVEGRIPAFTRHFRARGLRGDLPFSGDQQREAVLQLSLRDGCPADEIHIPAFADFIRPIALSMFTTPIPGSSLTWMLELLRDRYFVVASKPSKMKC